MIALMAIVKTGYPEYYRTQNDITDAVNLWADILQNENATLIGKALKEFIRTDGKGFPPKVGQLINISKDIRAAEQREEELARAKLPEPDGVPMPEELRERIDGLFNKLGGIT